MLFESVKAALRTAACLYCGMKTPDRASPFCPHCRETLGLREPRPVSGSGPACHAATNFNPAVKKLLYGYKFYGQHERASPLAGLLIHYWEALLSAQSTECTQNANELLVVPIPPHQPGKSRVTGFARRFARRFDYDFHPDFLRWRRSIVPQHTLYEKQSRFANVADSLYVNSNACRGHKRILVLDDLTTTGATLQEAARAIRQIDPDPAAMIALAVARVPIRQSLQVASFQE